MNNLAVLLYADAPNPNGIPANWPAETQPWKNQPSPWIEMTNQQLSDWKATYQSEYDTWQQNFEYGKNWQQDRYDHYPTVNAHLDAIVAMAIAQYPVPGTMPPLMQNIVNLRNAVDQQYPPPA